MNNIEFTSKMEEVYKVISNNDIKSDILLKYGFLADAISEGTAESLLESNKDTYRVILCETVLNWLKMERNAGSPLLTKYIQQYPGIYKLITDDKLIDLLLGVVGLEKSKFETFESISNGLKCFGIDSVESIDDDELNLNIDIDIEGENFQDLFDDDLDISDYLDTDELDESNELEELEKETDEENKIDTEETDKVEDDTQLSNIKDIWGSKIDTVIKSILASYSTLYDSGYGLVSPSGILTNNGIIRTNTKGELIFTGERPIDIEIFNAIQSVTNNKFSTFASPDKNIDIQEILKNPNIITYTGQHLKYMFGHIRFCTNNGSLKKYMTKNKILLPSEAKRKSDGELAGYRVNESETKIIKYSIIKGWIKETLEDIFLNAYRDVGIGVDITPQAIESSNQVNMMLSRTLKNIIVVAERKKGINTRLRICADDGISPHKIISTLQSSLNVGTSSLIKVKQIGEMANGVLDINIIYNDKTYSQDSLFAHEVLDILEEQEIVPSWDNVILGKKDDGTIMTYNFKDTKNPIYGLYAGTRSGKGVMTLNLLASALADGCKVAYIDGKPEIANVLTDIAWKEGLDAFSFNGLEVNSNFGLENRGNSIREYDRFASREHIPEDIFVTEDEVTTFMLTAHFLRGMELVIKMAKNRMDRCTPDDWLVAVFDECEQFASQEENLNKVLDRAYNRRKKSIDPNDPKGTRKINITTDPAAVFIDDFRMWRERLESEFITCVKSAFGKGNITVFFVWQSSKFPNIYKNTSSLAAMVESSRSKMIKIIGKSGVEQGGSNDFGNATTLKDMRWYDDRFSGQNGGFFAIGGNIKDNMKVFRPFNIFSDSNGRDLILTNAAAAGIQKEDLIGSQLDEDFNVIPEIGFEGYTNRLLGRMGLSAAKQLNIGYNYANSEVINLGLGRSLLEFIYNAHSFSGKGVLQEDELSELNFDGILQEDEDEKELDSDNDMFNYTDDDDELDFGVIDVDESEIDDDNILNKYGKQKVTENNNILKEVKAQQELLRQSQMERDNNRLLEQEDFVGTSENTGVWVVDPESGIEVINCNGKILTRQDVADLSGVLNLPINEMITFGYGGKTGRQRYIHEIPRTSEVIGLTTKNSIEATMNDYDTAERFQKLMFKGMWGTRWEFQKRWKAILASIAKNINENMVTRVTINSDNMFVNNRQVTMQNILGGDADVRLEDIVEFSSMFKKFKELKSLAMDSDITKRLCEIYPEDPVGQLFRMSSSLQTIVFVGDSWGTDSEQVTRQMYLQGEAEQELRERTDRAKLKSQIDAISASKNIRLRHKSPGYQSRIWESTKKFQGDAWGAVGKNITSKNPSLFKATTVSAAALLALGVGGALAGVGSILSLFKD